MLDKKILNRLYEWQESPVFGNEVKKELADLTEEELYDRFYCELEFGTSGVRGVLGAGTNRMNIYLIRRLSHSLGKVLLKNAEAKDISVVVACDSRRCSDEFALETALVLAAQRIKVYLFDALRPTPELSFAVRYLGAKAGVMITASHNPKEYNGYKVYGEDGAQLAPVYADEMTEVLNGCPWDVPAMTRQEAVENGLLEIIGEQVDEPYIDCIKSVMLQPELTAKCGKDLKIVYTPLHGAGSAMAQKAFDVVGFTDVFTVPEQEEPDTEFSTVKSPNPEDEGAWDLAIGYAKGEADLLLASDPDADRLGVQCRTNDGTYHHFTGNQIGVLLTNYVLEVLAEKGQLPDDGVVIQSMVSTALTQKIAAEFGVEQRIVPVGFRFIGEQIKEMEAAGRGTFLFGFEESIGYLKGTYTRDKDAVVAAVLTAEAALYYKENYGKTLYDVLQDIFVKYGCFMDRQVALKFEGAAGKQKIQELLETLAGDGSEKIAGQKVVRRYRDGKMVCIELENGGFIKGRPSGTEPKVRIYFCIGAADAGAAEAALEQAVAEITELIG